MPHLEPLVIGRKREDYEEQPSAPEDRSTGISVTERVEGGYRGELRLQLSGLTQGAEGVGSRHDRGDEAWPKRALQALFRGLGDRHAVEFSYEWLPDPEGASRFAWHIAGACSGELRSDVHDDAKHLYQSLELALGAMGAGLEFASIAEAQAGRDSRLRWQCDVAPAGIIVPVSSSAPAQPAAVKPIRQQIVLALPHPIQSKAFDSIIRIGKTRTTALRVTVRVEPFKLSERAREMLDTAYKSQRFGSGTQPYAQAGVPARLADDQAIDASLQQLRQWSLDPRGLRVRCSLYAEEALPPSLVDVIGREVFGERPVVVSNGVAQTGADDVEDACAVRLTNCFPLGECPVNLLPSMESLGEIGTRRVYTAIPTDLPDAGLTLGRCGRHGQAREVRLTDTERSRHSYVMGATGTGKSTLLRNMIVQDIEQGNGACVVDPHGDLYEQVLDAIPERRARDVVLVDLTDFEWSIGLNFLECAGANKSVQRNFIVNEMMTIFQRLYERVPQAMGPMFETYMRNAMLAVMADERRPATLLDVVRFFEDESFRAEAKAHCKNPMVASFWSRQAEKAGGEASFQNIAPYITCKLNQFTHNGLLRPIIGQAESTIDFRKCMDEGRIILVNLAKGLLGELDMRLLGMLLVGKIFSAALGRISMPQAERRPFYLYIDEFQNVVTPTIIGLLSEARKFGLSFTLANQYLGQLSDKRSHGVAEAVLGNVATMLFFRMGPTDAERMQTYTKPHVSAEDLQHLPDHHVACRMLNNNEPVRPFVFSTTPAPPPPGIADKTKSRIQQYSRERYALRRQQVEETIMQDWSEGLR